MADQTMADVLGMAARNFKDSATRPGTQFVSTGSPFADRVFGGDVFGGGVPRGGVLEISGDFSTGKTSWALAVCKQFLDNVCKPGDGIIYFDYEHSLDVKYARRAFGLNFAPVGHPDADPRIGFLAPNTIGQARKFFGKLFSAAAPARAGGKSGHVPVRLVVFDSVAAMNPDAFIEKAMEKDGERGKQIGLQAVEMARLFSDFVGAWERHDITVVLVNQTRANIQIGGYGAGPETTTTGGRALPFYAWVRVVLRAVGTVQVEAWDPITGQKKKRMLLNAVEVATINNKVATPFLKDVVHIRYGSGWDTAYTVVTKGQAYGLFHPDSKNSEAARQDNKVCYVTGDGKVGFAVWQIEVDPARPFYCAVEGALDGKRKSARPVKKVELLRRKTLLGLSEALHDPANAAAWQYLVGEVLRHYEQEADVMMTPAERRELRAHVGDAAVDAEDDESALPTRASLGDALSAAEDESETGGDDV